MNHYEPITEGGHAKDMLHKSVVLVHFSLIYRFKQCLKVNTTISLCHSNKLSFRLNFVWHKTTGGIKTNRLNIFQLNMQLKTKNTIYTVTQNV